MKALTKFIMSLVFIITLCGSLLPCEAATFNYNTEQSSIAITSYITLNKKATYQLNPTVNGTSLDTSTLEYTVSNPKVAKVDEDGLVTALKKGNTRITISDPEDNYLPCSIRIYVGKRATKLKLNASKKTIYVDNYFMLKASGSPFRTAMKKLRFTSSNPSVAKVSSKGKITALSEGSATITVSTLDGSNLTKSCFITVLEEEEDDFEEDDYDFFPFEVDSKSSSDNQIE